MQIYAIDAVFPRDVENIIFDYVGGDFAHTDCATSTKIATALASQCGGLFGTRLAVFPLLQHAIRAEYNAVKDMLNTLQRHSDVLLQTGQIADHNGYIYEGTLLQVLLQLRDVDVIVEVDGKKVKVVDGMAEMVAGFIREYHGEAEVLRQYRVLFPQDDASMEKKLFPADKEALNQITQAIRNSTTEEDCETALANFRDYFKSKKQRVNTEELLLEACNLYEINWVAFGGFFDDSHNSHKNRLFCINVIGYLQRLLPACMLQVFARGLHDVVMRGQRVERSYKFRSWWCGDVIFRIPPTTYAPKLAYSHYTGAKYFFR